VSWVGSWITFIIALAVMAGFWFGCYMAVKTWAPEYLHYFDLGLWIAGGLAGVMLVFNEPIVVLATGASRVKEPLALGSERKLWNAVMAVSGSMMIKPRVYLLPDLGMNAISFGWGIPFMSAVGATQGAVHSLSDEELQAVMAHEVGHILNKDILISTAMAASVMVMALTGWLLMRVAPWTGGRRSSSSESSSGGIAILVFLVVGGVMYIFGRLLGSVLQAFVSRQREYVADTTSARIMGSGEPLISALRKVTGYPSIGSDVAAAAVGFLCTADPNPEDMMATHPSLSDRIYHLKDLSGE